MFEWNYIKTREGYEHRLLAEAALGAPLPFGAEIYHFGDMRDNTRLVVCPNRAYHSLLHYRERALDACGHADWVKCTYCKEWGPEDTMYTRRRPRSGFEARHRGCHTAAQYH